MLVSETTLKELCEIINDRPIRRSGPVLVEFFNSLGFCDTYTKFPSRHQFTDVKLKQINGTPRLENCIKILLNPQKYIGNYPILKDTIASFNQFLAYDDYKIKIKGKEVVIIKIEDVDLCFEDEENLEIPDDQKEFLETTYRDISLKDIGLDKALTDIMTLRLEEISKCLAAEASLAVIFLSGSVLEGLLLGIALKYPKEFNQSSSAPKKDGICKKFPNWTLSNLIDVASDLKIIGEDVKKYSHSLRDFRNYMHPYMQSQSQFNPSIHTAKISFQVLKAAIFEIKESISNKS